MITGGSSASISSTPGQDTTSYPIIKAGLSNRSFPFFSTFFFPHLYNENRHKTTDNRDIVTDRSAIELEIRMIEEVQSDDI